MQKYCFSRSWVWLVSALWALPLAGADTNRWEEAIRAFEAADRINPPPQQGILFVGSSSIRLWKTLARDFPALPVINRGFGGSQLSDSIAFFDRIVAPHRPRQIVLYAGTNDLNAGKDPEQVFRDFQTFVARVRAGLPQTRVAFIAIAPNPARWKLVAQFQHANRLVRDYCQADPQLDFIDVFSAMLGADGQPKAGIYSSDQLHMNAEGYKLWTGLVRPYLK